jgi:16S rRNA (guanine(966)-N(2))-methyltransferase RsmD
VTRIIAGSARGRQLSVPERGTRPTSDRVREALFSAVSSMLAERGTAWGEVHVLDGYAGSGALGLEALSRGAASVVLIESGAPAADVIRRNIEALGLSGATVIRATVQVTAARRNAGPRASLILLDPPYEIAATVIADELSGLDAGGWVDPSAIAVVERPRADATSPFPPDWSFIRQRGYGDTVLWYGQRTSAAEVVDGDPGGQ